MLNMSNVVTAVASTVLAAALVGVFTTLDGLEKTQIENSTLLRQYVPMVDANSIALGSLERDFSDELQTLMQDVTEIATIQRFYHSGQALRLPIREDNDPN
jgi:hypothetical protein